MAVAQTLSAGPTRVTSDTGGAVMEAQVDYSQRVVCISIGDPSSPIQKLLTRGDVMYVLRGEGAADDLEPGTCDLLPDEEGATQVLANSFDPDGVKRMIMSSTAIVQNGREDIGGGVFATHFFVTPDPEAMVDLAMEALPEAMKPSGTDVREALRSEIPSRMHYWINDAGYLVKEDDGFQVKTYHRSVIRSTCRSSTRPRSRSFRAPDSRWRTQVVHTRLRPHTPVLHAQNPCAPKKSLVHRGFRDSGDVSCGSTFQW
ncbi:hypothetical protein [Rhodococcus gannanensis]|uniref:Uncharacterized protein n=1 Tax=Rhodococcus gannanensis TaxID=1960308 RepID=A0ABW4NZA3_9NOCA